MTDTEIINQLRKGNRQEAFNRLYRDFPKTSSIIRANNGTSTEARDIFQDALIILLRKVTDENFRLTSSLSTYLAGISKLLWMDELKKKNRISKTVYETPSDNSAELNSYLVEEEKYKAAERALDQIANACKKMLQMFYVEKLSMKKISELLSFQNEQSAKTQKYKCLEKAREIYKAQTSN